MGQIAMAEEGNQSLMLAQAKGLLDYGGLPTLSEVFKIIENVEASDIQEMAIEVFDFNKQSRLTYLPE